MGLPRVVKGDNFNHVTSKMATDKVSVLQQCMSCLKCQLLKFTEHIDLTGTSSVSSSLHGLFSLFKTDNTTAILLLKPGCAFHLSTGTGKWKKWVIILICDLAFASAASTGSFFFLWLIVLLISNYTFSDSTARKVESALITQYPSPLNQIEGRLCHCQQKQYHQKTTTAKTKTLPA